MFIAMSMAGMKLMKIRFFCTSTSYLKSRQDKDVKIMVLWEKIQELSQAKLKGNSVTHRK